MAVSLVQYNLSLNELISTSCRLIQSSKEKLETVSLSEVLALGQCFYMSYILLYLLGRVVGVPGDQARHKINKH